MTVRHYLQGFKNAIDSSVNCQLRGLNLLNCKVRYQWTISQLQQEIADSNGRTSKIHGHLHNEYNHRVESLVAILTMQNSYRLFEKLARIEEGRLRCLCTLIGRKTNSQSSLNNRQFISQMTQHLKRFNEVRCLWAKRGHAIGMLLCIMLAVASQVYSDTINELFEIDIDSRR